MSGKMFRNPLTAIIVALAATGGDAAAQTLVGDGSIACGEPYVVVPGDTLGGISERAYGDPNLFGILLEANVAAMGGNPENLAVGASLTIPCVNMAGQVMTAEEVSSTSASVAAAIAAEGPLSPQQLDALFGPVALFPDPVLSPLLVAVTYPLDVVKAGRFVADTADLSDKDRAAQAETQPWDESVRNLAAAFPDLVTRMSDHIDWTEQAGEAVLAQTDDVLDAIQRLRSKAQDNGYLVDNDAQNVVVEGDTITIAPADPQVVYVPTYSSQVVYTTPATSPPAYYYDDDDDWEDALAAGAFFLGSAIIIDEIFDDDWNGGWNDWGGGNNNVNIDWDGGDITIGGGDHVNIGGGDRVDIGGGDRVDIGGGDRVSIGDRDRPEAGTGGLAAAAAGGAAGASIANAANRDAARQKIQTRQSSGAGAATLPAARPSASRPSAGTRPATGARPAGGDRKAPAAKPSAPRAPKAQAPSRSNTFSAPSGGGRSAGASASRGRSSTGGGRGGGRR